MKNALSGASCFAMVAGFPLGIGGIIWAAFKWASPWLIDLGAPEWVSALICVLIGGWIGFYIGLAIAMIFGTIVGAMFE